MKQRFVLTRKMLSGELLIRVTDDNGASARNLTPAEHAFVEKVLDYELFTNPQPQTAIRISDPLEP